MANKEGHVSLWHPWPERGGIKHTLAMWSDFDKSLPVNEIIGIIGNGAYYALCTDILSSKEVNPELLRNEKTEAYISRTGKVAALRVRGKRKSGFLIPGIQWCSVYPSYDTLENMRSIFQMFKMEALTPSSLSEKILRRTLPDRLFISRPSVPLRKTFLENRSLARILQQKSGYHSDECYEYDGNKMYLSIAAKGVPDPFTTPVRFYGSDIWQDYDTAWVKATMTAHGSGLQPMLLKEKGIEREAYEGEIFTKWIWKGKLEDCLSCGYTLHEVEQGYVWTNGLSPFMSQWANIMYESCEKSREEPYYDILKRMTQGLPGRFLRPPEIYTLVHFSERQDGDEPLTANWTNDESPMSDWFIRIDSQSEQARESAQLTPIGDYIVAEAERDIFLAAKKIEREEKENKVVRIYVDSISTIVESTTIEIGRKAGQFKVKRYAVARFKDNRFRGEDEQGNVILKAPGIAEDIRVRYLKGEDLWKLTGIERKDSS